MRNGNERSKNLLFGNRQFNATLIYACRENASPTLRAARQRTVALSDAPPDWVSKNGVIAAISKEHPIGRIGNPQDARPKINASTHLSH